MDNSTLEIIPPTLVFHPFAASHSLWPDRGRLGVDNRWEWKISRLAVENCGMSRRRAAVQFGVGINTVITWVRHFRETGSVAPGKMGGPKPKAIAGAHRIWLLQRIDGKDFTIRGLVAEFAARGLKVDYRSVWNFLHAEKLSFKKTLVVSERDRPDIARKRAQWKVSAPDQA